MKINKFIFKGLTALLLGLLLAENCHAELAQEYKLKTAFIYNFMQLTGWPKSTPEILHLCVLEADPIIDAIQAIDGANANGRKIKIMPLSKGESAANCEALYLGTIDRLDIHQVMNNLSESPVLTMSDNLDLAHSGIMLTMFPEKQRLLFRVNLESAKRAHLSLSSRLVRLAKAID